MKTIDIPTQITIAPDNILGGVSGDNVADYVKNQATGHKRVLLSMSYGGNLLGRGSAQAVFFEPNETGMLITPSLSQGFTGKWIFSFGGHTRFIGFMTGVDSQRVAGGSIRTYNFTDVLQAWDILLTNQIYNPDPHTVHKLLNDIVYNAITLSGVTLQDSHVPPNSTDLSDLFENGVYAVTNSTYLAEIQKICQALGYVVFCDVGFGTVTIKDIFNLNRPLLDFNKDYILDASFSADYLGMASTVLVNDDQSMKGIAYGHLGTGANKNDIVYNLTRINNLFFATTSGVKDSALGSIAQKIYAISKNESRVLTLKKAGDEFSSLALGSDIVWSDSLGGTQTYTIFEYETTISRTEYSTTYKAFVKI